MDRRDFIKQSLLATGSMMAAGAFGMNAFGQNEPDTAKVTMDFVTLNNDVRMPILGYGTLRLTTEQCADCVAEAIHKGWRLIDTAKNYMNETEVGKGIRQSGIPREELFITSKLWIEDYGYE